ncbi:MAG: hypothetical protein MZV63_44725 [Marinilabiliales bacterium]|nr:hypothetical protein [Marinilabiliales bacterium]
MDLILLFILTGVALAYFKRFYSKLFGMKKTTSLRLGDKFALASLWLIFPLRLFAESTSASLHQTGGFLTQNFGNWISGFIPATTFEPIILVGLFNFIGSFLFSAAFFEIYAYSNRTIAYHITKMGS